MNMRYLVAFAISILVIGSIAAYFLWRMDILGLNRTPTLSPNQRLERTSSDYLEAKQYVAAQRYRDALNAYERALSDAKNAPDSAQIKFKIGAMHALLENRTEAVKVYKEIVRDPTAYPIVKAYAVLHTGLAYYMTLDPSLDNQIFEGEPFRHLRVPDDTQLSYRKLFEYGSSLYPLALTELYIAQWYAEEIGLAAYIKKPLPDELQSAYLTQIEGRLQNAERDIERTRNDANANALIPPALQVKANTLGLLWLAGLKSEQEVTSAYDQALQLYSVLTYPGQDGFTRLWYAMFLTQADAQKHARKISELINPISANPVYATAPIAKYLKALANVDGLTRAGVIRLADNNLSFKRYLIANGWNEKDF